MKKTKKLCALIAAALVLLDIPLINAYAQDPNHTGFVLTGQRELSAQGGTMYCFEHKKTGAQVVYLDNHSERLAFSIGFKTPPADNKGANHVLEHGLLCGSEKYPTKNIMHYLREGTSSLILNAVTADDYTYYLIQTSNKTEYDNVMDVYLNGIFHPLLLRDENIFRQQGVRLEYADGKVQYNGVVYNELRIKNLDTESNSINFLSDALYTELYGNTSPAFSSGGTMDALKELTYADLLQVYHTYYTPSNSMTYLSGKQDVHQTLATLDRFFSEHDKREIPFRFEDTKRIPAEPVSEYNVTSAAKTVDIGFMSSGVPLDSDAKELYARDILFQMLQERMERQNRKNYVSGGNAGGISNLALLLSEVPIEKKDEIIAAYKDALKQLETNGFDENELDSSITEYMQNKKESFYSGQENIFNGLLYQNDPFVFADVDAVQSYLTEHKEYFTQILKKYFTENPYSKIVVSGNGTSNRRDDTPQVSEAELEKIRRETEDFQKWADQPDPREVVEKIPFLPLDEAKEAPQKAEPVSEEANGISFYHTDKDAGGSAGLHFPLAIQNSDLDYAQLMACFLLKQAQQADLNAYFGLEALENGQSSTKMVPQIAVWISGEDKAETLRNVLSFLQDETTWNADALKDYIRSAPDAILKNSYHDPYYLSYELMQSALSAEKRFYSCTTGSVQQGSPRYYRFLKSLDPDAAPEILEKIKTLAAELIVRSKPVAEYVGNDGYHVFKETAAELFQNAEQRKNTVLQLPMGYYSAATITNFEDANHFMLAGFYDKTKYSGKLAVLGKVLSAKYILPTMRGKHGAYGAGVSFYDSNMISSVAGLADIDLTLSIWQGMGDYLRSLDMTQKELDAIKVSALKEYDEYEYMNSEYGALMAISEKTPEDFERVREEMLAVTVEDLKGYAGFVDHLVAQNRVFAVLGQSAADRAKFEFLYYADSDTLEVTPKLKKYPQAYISGKTEKQFAPDDFMTRAEAAAILSRLLADGHVPENGSCFDDVPKEAWYHDAVVSVSEKGLLSGYGDNTFRPEQNITRGELAAMLSKLIFKGNGKLDNGYSDLSEDDWFYEPLAKMINAGLLKGYEDGTLRPGNPVTRAEAVAVINRMLPPTSSGEEKNRFDDVPSSHWAFEEIRKACNR